MGRLLTKAKPEHGHTIVKGRVLCVCIKHCAAWMTWWDASSWTRKGMLHKRWRSGRHVAADVNVCDDKRVVSALPVRYSSQRTEGCGGRPS